MVMYTREQVRSLVDALKADKVLVLPTDTVWGLVARALSYRAYKNMTELKPRPASKPYQLITADLNQLFELTDISSELKALIRKLEPLLWGLTLILKASDKLPTYLSYNHKVGIRVTSDEGLLALMGELGEPLIASSANPTGKPVATNLEEAKRYFGKYRELVVFSPVDIELKTAKPSTVVQFKSDNLNLGFPKPEILREGVVSYDELIAYLNIKGV